MGQKQITETQFTAAALTALLSPMVRLLPRAAALQAGRWAWLCVPAAVPLLLALGLVMDALRRGMGPGEGAAALFLRVFGPVLGRAFLLLYAGWFLLYAGFVLRSGAERLTAAAYPHSGPEPFVLLLLALALLASLGTLRAAARTAMVLRGALLAVLGAVFLLSAQNLEPENLFPLTAWEPAGFLAGTLSAATVGGTAALLSFLRGYTAGTEGEGTGRFTALALFCASALLLCLTTVGVFGARLTARLSYPFFTMVRGLSLPGRMQRFDAVVIALWVLTDYVLCTLMLRCAHEALRTVFRLPEPERRDGALFRAGGGRWLLWAEAAAAGVCAFVLPADAEAFRRFGEGVLPLVMDLFVFGGFPLLWLVGKMRKLFPGK